MKAETIIIPAKHGVNCVRVGAKDLRLKLRVPTGAKWKKISKISDENGYTSETDSLEKSNVYLIGGLWIPVYYLLNLAKTFDNSEIIDISIDYQLRCLKLKTFYSTAEIRERHDIEVGEIFPIEFTIE